MLWLLSLGSRLRRNISPADLIRTLSPTYFSSTEWETPKIAAATSIPRPSNTMCKIELRKFSPPFRHADLKFQSSFCLSGKCSISHCSLHPSENVSISPVLGAYIFKPLSTDFLVAPRSATNLQYSILNFNCSRNARRGLLKGETGQS